MFFTIIIAIIQFIKFEHPEIPVVWCSPRPPGREVRWWWRWILALGDRWADDFFDAGGGVVLVVFVIIVFIIMMMMIKMMMMMMMIFHLSLSLSLSWVSLLSSSPELEWWYSRHHLIWSFFIISELRSMSTHRWEDRKARGPRGLRGFSGEMSWFSGSTTSTTGTRQPSPEIEAPGVGFLWLIHGLYP